MRRATGLLLLLVLGLAACGGGRGTPREAYDSLRSALATRDGASVYALHDGESRAFYRAHVREVRARLQRGDDPGDVLADPTQTPELFLAGEEDDATARFMAGYSEVALTWGWLQEAVVVEDTLEDDDHARIRVRGTDGIEKDLYFVREPAGWAHDEFRQFTSR